MGKSGSEKRLLNDKLTIRMSDELMFALETDGKAAGMSATSLARILLAEAVGLDARSLPKRPAPRKPKLISVPENILEIAAAVGQLSLLANQLQRIEVYLAKALKQDGEAPLVEDCQAAIFETAEIIAEVRQMLRQEGQQ